MYCVVIVIDKETFNFMTKLSLIFHRQLFLNKLFCVLVLLHINFNLSVVKDHSFHILKVVLGRLSSLSRMMKNDYAVIKAFH